MFSIDPFACAIGTFMILGVGAVTVSLIRSEEATRPVKKNILTAIVTLCAAGMIGGLFWKLITGTPL